MPQTEFEFSLEAFDGAKALEQFNHFLKVVHEDINNQKKDPSKIRSVMLKMDISRDAVGRTIADAKVTIKLADEHGPKQFRMVGDLKREGKELIMVMPKAEKGQAA